MSADQVRRALADVCGYHTGPDCQHCADTYAHAQLHKGMSDDDILRDIELYRTNFGAWEQKVRAASGDAR